MFLQSSGMGKSRLADAFGQGCPMINYVLREEGTLGFPPADDEILSFMGEQEESLNESPHDLPSKKYLKKRMDMTWYHSLAVGLLQASFEILNTWVEEPPRAGMRLNDLAALRHKEMAYNSESEETVHNSKSEGLLNRRSTERIEFCKSVATRAEKIVDDLIQKPTWRQVFDLEGGSAIRHELTKKRHLNDLLNAAKKLTDNLGKFRSENKCDPPLVVVFDEASSLLRGPGKQGEIRSERYIALNRIMSCLKEYRIWFFIISTDSQVGTIVPPDNAERTNDYVEDPSLRWVEEFRAPLKHIPPFLALRVNIEDRRRMQGSTRDKLGKSLSDFGKPKHMGMLGRRLWHAYVDDPEAMNRLAKLKLIGGVRMGLYQPHNQHHVFAALSFRLSLDASWYKLKALPLIRTAINSHMRVVISIDLETGTMATSAPSEPILAKAAMEHLCSGLNWSISIDTLVRELLEQGLVEKGLKGELYARLVVTLAHDWVRCRRGQQVSGEADGELHQNTNSDGELYQSLNSDGELYQNPNSDGELHQNTNSDGGIHQGANSGGEIHQESNPDFRPKFMKSFTVNEFLQALYAEEGHESIMKIDPKILEARMNFTHFAPIQGILRAGTLSKLFVNLLRRSAALQLGPVQPTYDILIPIYLGKEDEALEPSKCSCIVIQVKNRDETTTPGAILHEEFTMVSNRKRGAPGSSLTKASTKAKKEEASEIPSTKSKKEEASESASTEAEKKKEPFRNTPNFVFNRMKNPILFLLFDFGGARTERSIAPSVEVSYSSNIENVPRVWAIHSRGHDQKVFGCLSLMGCVEAGKMFFTSAVPGASTHDQAARENEFFSEPDESFSEAENEDEDMGIKGGYEMVEGGHERDSKRRRGVAEENEDMDVEMEDNHAIVPPKKPPKQPRRAPAKRSK